jgi:hypothetical protein
VTTETPPAADDGSFDRARQHWLRRRPLLDAVGAFVWIYAVVQVFISDFDTAVFGTGANYRFFFFLGLAAVLALVMQKRWAIIAGFVYVMAFPAVVLCWKLPKLLGKTRSPVAFLAAANVLTLVFSDLKRSILLTALTVFATLAVAASHWALFMARPDAERFAGASGQQQVADRERFRATKTPCDVAIGVCCWITAGRWSISQSEEVWGGRVGAKWPKRRGRDPSAAVISSRRGWNGF